MLSLTTLTHGIALVRDALVRQLPGSCGSIVLTARVVFRNDQSLVSLELVTTDAQPGLAVEATSQKANNRLTWEVPFTEFQSSPCDHSLAQFPPPELVVPQSLIEDLRYHLANIEDASSRVFWLKLVRPYGLLGSIPWERALDNCLDRPLLRLPDFPERPSERADILEIALLVDPAPETSQQDIIRRVRVVTESTLGGSSRATTRIHIFTRNDWFPTLRILATDPRITVHNPNSEQPSLAEISATQLSDALPLRSAAWSNWIVSTLAGRGLDAVHLICRTQWTDSGADLLLSSSPSQDEKKRVLQAVDLEELNLLLNRAGAWAITFVPETQAQQRSTAYIADAFAQRRPGAVLFHPLENAEQTAAFSAACRVLFSPQYLQVPRLGDGFLYCHPRFIHTAPANVGTELFNVLTDNARLLELRAPLTARLRTTLTSILPGVKTAETPAPPNWLAAMQRYLESAVFEEVRRSAADVLLSGSGQDRCPVSPETSAQNRQTRATLEDIQNVVRGYLESHKKEP